MSTQDIANVHIVREFESPMGILGSLTCEHGGLTFRCLTLELPYEKNIRNTSSIPTGSYLGEIRYSKKFKNKRLFVNSVPKRSGILFHEGNSIEDTKGCILLGLLRGANPFTLRRSKAAVITLSQFFEIKNIQYAKVHISNSDDFLSLNTFINDTESEI